MADSSYDMAKHSMSGGDHAKPAKVIDHIKSYKSASHGKTVHETHHTHPEHHPMEKHVKSGDDEMAEHMMANLGTQNPGEAAADPSAAGAAPPDPSAAVAPAGSGTPAGPMPGAGA